LHKTEKLSLHELFTNMTYEKRERENKITQGSRITKE